MQIDLNSPVAKWRRDLVTDIRVGDTRDDWDMNGGGFPSVPDRHIEVRHPTDGYIVTMSACNLHALQEQFMRVKHRCAAILEIGVNHNATPTPMTSTNMFLSMKHRETIYLGVDINDKSYLNNPGENVFTLQSDSGLISDVISYANTVGIRHFDFIFIDGWHSVNQVLREWEYTSWLGPNGIVGFHDTAVHPGPALFVKNLDRDKWNVLENSCGFAHHDFGIGFAWQK
jgi:hypothetical protein